MQTAVSFKERKGSHDLRCWRQASQFMTWMTDFLCRQRGYLPLKMEGKGRGSGFLLGRLGLFSRCELLVLGYVLSWCYLSNVFQKSPADTNHGSLVSWILTFLVTCETAFWAVFASFVFSVQAILLVRRLVAEMCICVHTWVCSENCWSTSYRMSASVCVLWLQTKTKAQQVNCTYREGPWTCKRSV